VYSSDGGLVVSPTDLTRFQACTHLTALDLAVAEGERARPFVAKDEVLELLFRKGLEHEQRYLEALESERAVTVIDTEAMTPQEAAEATESAMANAASVIYQATFVDGGQRGHADFLLRGDRPSRFGNWAYDVADTKLARRLRVPALLQMAGYGEHLRRIQGAPPVTLTVVAGDGLLHEYPFADVESYARRVSARFAEFVRTRPTTVAQPVPHCQQCRWIAECYRGWRQADHLSFVAFLTTAHREKFEQAGITTLANLAAQRPSELPRSIGRATRDRLIRQASLQLHERDTGVPAYELLDPVDGQGLLRLPTPDEADLYLDFEADRYIEPDGREYLAGFGDRAGMYTAIWAHSFDQERALTEQLIDAIVARWRAHPGMHVYHYAPYEKAALRRLTARHGVREAELDVLLRAEVFVDLYAVMRQGLRISKESYSIKKLEAFYWGHVRGQGPGDVTEALSSVLAYETWLVDNDNAALDSIAAYNKDDVDSTRDLHIWLEERRDELATKHQTRFPRPNGTTVEETEPSEAERAELVLAQRLVDGGEPLLAGLVGWHRREARPAWWDVYRLEDLDEDELINDATAIGGLGEPVWQYDVKRSHVHRYNFPPQDTKLGAGDTVLNVDDHKPAGAVVGIDPAEGWIDLRIGRTKKPSRPRGLGPQGPLDDTTLRAAIADVATRVLEDTDCLGARLLRLTVPPGLPVQEDETAAAALIRLGIALRGEVLAVQGPPGTGKSTKGAALIRALLDQGLRVGVTALSHQVIGGMLLKVDRPGLQRCNDEADWCGAPRVDIAGSTPEVVQALTAGTHNLVGGTAWLWAHDIMQDLVDVLVIDEAGQFSLANAVAVTRAARSLVLLGDPQQLTQPTQAQHPYGADVSALDHLLSGHDTMPPDRGVFLDCTWRMHPAVNEFVSITSYEGRLHTGEGTERQRIIGTGRWHGAGPRWVPVEHVGNVNTSSEEAAVVAQIVEELLDMTWTNADGVEAPITPRDVLLVAPYNAHVGRLHHAVADGVQVGTVDKFQGRQGAVVIYSLASSSAQDAPRGIDFLYDVHRLNVAVSRARAMAIVVGSPALLDAEVHTPIQLRQVNALCRYVELAGGAVV
jgi:uncharacterized protein